MSVIESVSENPRLELRLRAESFSDDLGAFGRSVRSRVGPDKRTKAEKEDWCLRRLLIALHYVEPEKLPIEVMAFEPNEARPVPDYVLKFSDREIIGVEVTEATHPDFQRWLTHTERSGEMVSLFPGDGYAGDEPERIVVRDLSRALKQKIERYERQRYQAVPQCDLLIYESSEGSVMADSSVTLERFVQAWPQRDVPFRQVHILRDGELVVDVLRERQSLSLRADYDHDFLEWLDQQAKLAREGRFRGLDLPNIAEEVESLARRERRAFRSHLRNLLVHLIKWQCQEPRRSASWLRSIANTRYELEELMADSPSLAAKPFLETTFQEQYPKARKRVLREVKLKKDAVPLECPFTLEQIFDDDFPMVEDG